MKRSLALVALLLALVAARSSGQTMASGNPPEGWAAFTRTFQAYADSDRVVGASVLVMRHGRVLARHDTGFMDQAAGKKVNERTIFHWGSITKTLTAVAILQLRDRGKLSLDDRVTRWVPELRLMHDPYNAMDSITIRMLLSHSAGFQGGTWPYTEGREWEPFEPTTWAQLVAMMPYQQLHFRPGSRYSYSNPAFVYLARIVEEISGDPWDSYVQKNIFAPLALGHSYFRGTPYYLTADRSHNYSIQRDSASKAGRFTDNGADFDPGITTPNGGWNAPLTDLAAYTAFLTDQKLPTPAPYEVVLKRSSLEEMWRPVVPLSQQGTAVDSMGLSFFLQRRAGERVIGHTGSQAGFRSFFYFNPKTSTAVIAAFNTTNYANPASAAWSRMHQGAIGLLW